VGKGRGGTDRHQLGKLKLSEGKREAKVAKRVQKKGESCGICGSMGQTYRILKRNDPYHGWRGEKTYFSFGEGRKGKVKVV